MKFVLPTCHKLLVKTIYVIVTMALIISFSSFQKPVVSNKVKSEINTSDTTEKFFYSYDTAGRLIGFESEKYGIKRSYDYSIPDSIIIIEWLTKSGKRRQAWSIDTNGYLLTGLNVKYTYNQQGFLIESVYSGFSKLRKEVYTISNGDETKKEVLDDGTVTATTESTFFDTKDNRDYGQPFRGRRSVHLKKTETELYKDGPTQSTYAYTFDNFRRVITKTISSPKGKFTWAYTYEN